MGDWNYNQYSGYPWEGNRNQRNMQPEMRFQNNQHLNANQQSVPQYVGFQEFLNQYQQYPMNDYQNQHHQTGSQRYPAVGNFEAHHYPSQYNQTIPQSVSSVQNSYGNGSRVPSEMMPGQNYPVKKSSSENRYNQSDVDQSAVFQNRLYSNDFSSDIGQNKSSAAATSKLTPTAEEFIPSCSRADVYNPINDSSAGPSNRNEFPQSKAENKTSPLKSAVFNSRKTNNLHDSKKSTNWRDRDDDNDEFSHSNIPSTVIENNKDKKSQRDYNRSTAKNKDSQQNTKPKYNERNSTNEERERSSINNDKDRHVSNNDRDRSGNGSDRNKLLKNNRMQNYDPGNDETSHLDPDHPNYSKNYRSQRSNDYQNSESNRKSDRYSNSYRSTESFQSKNQRSYDDYGNGESYRNGRSQRSNSDYQHSEFNRNNRNQNSNSDNHDPDSDNSRFGNRGKSYMTNETFRQKNYPKKYENYGNKENDQDYSYSRGGLKTEKKIFNPSLRKNNFSLDVKDIDGVEVSQRERLTEQLNKGLLECLVCCERIKQIDSIWSCGNCFHVLHLNCIIRWAKSSITEGSWRCPACQNNNSLVPNKYLCFCGKQSNPEWSRGGDSAHTCGNICGRLPPSCLRHPCTLLCHAGPCPQCDAVVQKKCECGATSQSLRCSHSQPLLCDQICKKPLNCKVHFCEEKCHAGICQPCTVIVEQKCHCSKHSERSLPCDVNTVGVKNYSCNEVCDKKLECSNHNCVQICHDGQCEKCSLLPENVKKCPCGQTLLTPEQKRKSCLDPIPVCNKICSKKFSCGPADSKHVCQKLCHAGDCPPCPEKTIVSCRCGHINTPIMCVKLEEERNNVRCKKKCSKKQSCGRHRCKTLCCIDIDHRCPLPCNRSLTCGLHRCEDTCHSGHCDPCWRTGFDELRCRCGAAVRYPPIACGTRPPPCDRPCSLPRPCGHDPLHVCHPEPTACTPCTVLTQRYCYGRHKMRKAIPCHQEEFSCGLPCGKDLPCKKHKCIETCHKGICPTVCTQPCETERSGCSHQCGAACGHPSPCPVKAPCKKPVNVSCLCSRRTAVKACADHTRDLQRLIATAGMLEGTMGQPVDIKALIEKGNTTTTLDCDDECYVEERNRRMAIGLQIRNPDVSSKLTPRYSDFMKQFLTRDESFCVKVHEKLTELVLLAQKSKQKTRSHSFQPMNHLKRQFIHEYCDHFGCESKAYDSEPHRNIVATAFREKSWLPALSLMEVVRRDKGQRRVPGPVVGSSSLASSGTASVAQKLTSGAWSTLGGTNSLSESTRLPITSVELEPPRKPKIDYFDAPPED